MALMPPFEFIFEWSDLAARLEFVGIADEIDGRVIEEGDYVPQYISCFCLQQQTSLTDRELSNAFV